MNNPVQSVITAHPFFKGMKPEHQAVLYGCARVANFEPGTTLFNEGEPANEFYLVESGKVALEIHDPRKGTAHVANVDADGCFGWSWLYPPFVWHLRARVVEPTTAIVLNGAHLLIHAEEDHDFGFELMKRVSRIVISRLQSTRRELLAKQSASGTLVRA
ncbi:MAG: Crp/Fnr family transcriptional regulator [Limisphaerales bacterium]